ncbi:MAG: FtsX-like permease family protein [Verrucomicrobiota bacterium]
MISHLDRKLFRDLRRMKGQAVAVSLVIACGLAMLIMSRSLIYSLDGAREEYYRARRFSDVFAGLKRAPLSVADRIRAIPGVAAIEPGVSVPVTLDIPNLDEPASGLVRSLPDFREPELNRLFLRAGHWLKPGSRGEVLVGEAFADANQLRPGHSITMVLNGRLQKLRIAGIVLSPEYIFESRPGAALPDNRTYGIFWMPGGELASAFDLDGSFNSVAVALAPGASEKSVIAGLDRLLLPYGGRGAYGRADHPSHIRVSDEIRVLTILSVGFPAVFLCVAGFMANAVVARLLALQRDQIAILKAFGFGNREIVLHYLKFAFAFVLAGAVGGVLGGVFLGHQLVRAYHVFFRFPELKFQLDPLALVIALGVAALATASGVFSAVRRAARLPPAEAMRPEPPASYRPAFVERTGVAHLFSNTFRIAVRNLERKPAQVFFTVAGLALATGILIIPNAFRDSVNHTLEFQWDTVQRQDVSVGLVEPDSESARHALRQLPGVRMIEPFRYAVARVRFGQRQRQIAIQGLDPDGQHARIIDRRDRLIPLPAAGLAVSSKLAEVLGAKLGDRVTIEFLEGRRRRIDVPLVALSEDFSGLMAHMDRRELNRLLGEGDIITGASFRVDGARWKDFLRNLKVQPRVSWVVVKESLRANFRATTAAMIGLIQTIYLVFATIVAFGVVYNNARISLAERGRELATLRVIGFSRREVGAVLVTELAILALIAVPLGLAFGTLLARGILSAVNTETVRLPVILTLHNYAFAVTVVAAASTISALLVLRTLSRLDLVSVLKSPE